MPTTTTPRRKPKVERFTVQCGRTELAALRRVAKALDPVRPNRSAAARHLFRLGIEAWKSQHDPQPA